MEQSEIINYNDHVKDIDEIQGTDVKINPDFYIHNALMKAQHALTKDNMKEGFAQFRLIVEHIEVLCKAGNMLTEDYHEKLKEYMGSEEYGKEDQYKSVKLANKKIELLMSEVFKNKITTDPLKA